MNKLKELVSKGIEGGWNPRNYPSKIEFVFAKKNKITIKYYYLNADPGDPCVGEEHVDYSLPDLIDDDKFMKLIFGEERKEMNVFEVRYADKAFYGGCECDCSVPITGPRYRIIQMIASMFSGDAQVKYLHKMMKETP